MPQCGWANCPADVRRVTLAVVEGLSVALGDELLGVYLHGSLAMGCFNPQRGDIDLLAVTRGRLDRTARPRLARLLLQQSGVPSGMELSVLSRDDLQPWRHPAPYEFHYSEDWRERTQARLDAGMWPEGEDPSTDPDLAAHITVTLARGVRLWGQPPADTLPEVPAADYAAAIVEDFQWGRGLLGVNPVYFVLNACRVRAFVQEGRVLSKDEGGVWGLSHLPAEMTPVVGQALQIYRGDVTSEMWQPGPLEAFARSMAQSLGLPEV